MARSLAKWLILLVFACTQVPGSADEHAPLVTVQPCPRSTWLIPKIDWFKDGVESAARDDIPVMFNEIVDGRVTAFATPESLESVIAFYTSEFRSQGFKEIQEYTGSAEHMRGRYKRGEDLAWVSAQVSGDARLYRYLARGQRIPPGYHFVMVVIGKDSKAPPPVAVEEKVEAVALPFKPFPHAVELKLRLPRFSDGTVAARRREITPGAGFVLDGEAQAWSVAAPMAKVLEHYLGELDRAAYKLVQKNTKDGSHFFAVFSKENDAAVVEVFRDTSSYSDILAPDSPLPGKAKGTVGIVVIRGRKNFF